MHILVSLEGVPGAGKTTVMKHLNDCGIHTIQEPLSDFGPLLPAVAACRIDPCAFQIAVLCSRYACQFKALTGNTAPTMFVTERSMGADKHVFAATTLPAASVAMEAYTMAWERLSATMNQHVQLRTVYVYLRCDAETALARVQRRNRSGEGGISQAYLQQLVDAHEAWLPSCCEVYEIDATAAPASVAARIATIALGIRQEAALRR